MFYNYQHNNYHQPSSHHSSSSRHSPLSSIALFSSPQFPFLSDNNFFGLYLFHCFTCPRSVLASSLPFSIIRMIYTDHPNDNLYLLPSLHSIFHIYRIIFFGVSSRFPCLLSLCSRLPTLCRPRSVLASSLPYFIIRMIYTDHPNDNLSICTTHTHAIS